MSEWYDAKKEDIKRNGDEVDIWVTSGVNGNVYVSVKVSDLKKVLLDKPKKK